MNDASRSGEAPVEVDLRDAVGAVRWGAAAIDRLWSRSLGGSSTPELTLALGEASQALHRALLVLDDRPAEAASGARPARDPVVAPGRYRT